MKSAIDCKGSWLRCSGESGEVLLSFAGASDYWNMIGEAKNIAGRRYREMHNGLRKVHIYPHSSLPAVVEFADKWGISVSNGIRVMVETAKTKQDQARKKAQRAAAAREALPAVRLDENGLIIIDRDPDGDSRRLNAALKRVNNDRATWDAEDDLHHVSHRDPDGLKKVIAEFGLTVSREAQELLDNELAVQETNFRESSASTAEPVYVPGLASDVVLKDLQWAAVRWGAKHRRTWYGDAPGFGKSLSGLATVAVTNAYPLIIVCMPSLVRSWKRETSRFPHNKVYVAESQMVKPIPPGTDVVIIGTAALGHIPRAPQDDSKVFPWVKALATIRPKALIIDEGQIAKEESASRTQALKELAGPIVEADGVILILTGNAMMNRARELGTQLEIMGRVDEFGGLGAYLDSHCVSEVNSRGKRFEGSRHLDKLHYKLRAYGIMLRRSDLSLLGLKPANRQVLWIDRKDADPRAMAQYYEAERDVVNFLADKAEALARRYGVDPKDARVRAAMRAQRAEQLVKMNELRAIVGRAKVPFAERWAREKTADGRKVMIAAHHKEVTRPLAHALGGLRIVGTQSASSKEADTNKFFTDPNARVMTISIEAGGTGHTLHANGACADGLHVEQLWTPTSIGQAEGRLLRIGQPNQVNYTILLVRGTIDEHMYDVVTAKQIALDAVLDGKAAEGVDDTAESMAADVAWQLVESRGFGGRA